MQRFWKGGGSQTLLSRRGISLFTFCRAARSMHCMSPCLQGMLGNPSLSGVHYRFQSNLRVLLAGGFILRVRSLLQLTITFTGVDMENQDLSGEQLKDRWPWVQVEVFTHWPWDLNLDFSEVSSKVHLLVMSGGEALVSLSWMVDLSWP